MTPELTTNSYNGVPIRWKDRAFYRNHRRKRPVAERESNTLLSVPVDFLNMEDGGTTNARGNSQLI